MVELFSRDLGWAELLLSAWEGIKIYTLNLETNLTINWCELGRSGQVLALLNKPKKQHLAQTIAQLFGKNLIVNVKKFRELIGLNRFVSLVLQVSTTEMLHIGMGLVSLNQKQRRPTASSD